MAIALFVVFGVALVGICGWTMIFGPAWLWRMRQWARVGLMVGLGIAGGLGAWFAARDAERVEPVWLDVATGIKPLAAPIRVRMAADLDTYAEAVHAAVRMWNRQAGCQLFAEEPPESLTYDVRLVFLKGTACNSSFTVLADRSIAASTYFCDGGGVDISVERLDEMQAAYVIFAHELGHVLGLAHDPIGLMAPLATAQTLVLPSYKDARAVRERYCVAGAK